MNGKISILELDSPLYEDWQSCTPWYFHYWSTLCTLKNLFSQGNGPKIYNLQREISQISQNQMIVTEYYTKFKWLWDQLLNFEPFLECSCGAMKILSASHDKAYEIRFLKGLNENFETLRSQNSCMILFLQWARFIHWYFKKNHPRTLDMEVQLQHNLMQWLCTPIPKEIPIGIKVMQRKTNLFALTATCKGTQLRSATSCMDILQVTNLKGRLEQMLMSSSFLQFC